MSLLPFFYDLDPWDLRRRRRNDWDLFGSGITPSEIRELMSFPRLQISSRGQGELSPAKIGKDGFQVCIDVQQFLPNEITVKTVDNSIVVEGKHEEREDEHGYISRHFVRRYALPKGYDTKEVVSSLSSDGVLTVKAPIPSKELEGNERVIHIQQTGPAHLNVKENVVDKESEK